MSRNFKQATTLLATQTVIVGFFPVAAQAVSFSLQEATIADIKSAFSSGLSCTELTQLYLNRIQAYDKQGPAINAIIATNPNALATAASLDAAFATSGATGPLHCIPTIVKDNYDTFDLPTTAGSLSLKGSVPPNDSFIVQKMREAGAIILAKSNLAEFAFSGANSLSSLGGQTLNPYALDRVPAGSSGGTAAAIAANFGAVGLGTDTGSSIRGPASVNNLVGLRPTIGLISRDGIIPLDLGRDVGGPITRTVADAAMVLDVIAGYDLADPVTEANIGKIPDSYTSFLDVNGLKGARIGVLRELIETDTRPTTPSFVRGISDPEVVATTNAAIEDMRTLGAEIIDPATIPNLYGIRSATGGCDRFKYDINNYLASLGPDAPVKSLTEIIESAKFDPSVEAGLVSSQEVELSPQDNPACQAAEQGEEAFRVDVLKVLDDYNLDAFVYPTFKNPPRLIGDLTSPYGGNSSLISPPTGFPAINVPMGFTANGLPLGIQFLGRAFSEPTLLKLAYSYEQGTQHRRPPESTPPLLGETIPEPGTTTALTLFGLTALGLKFKQRREFKTKK